MAKKKTRELICTTHGYIEEILDQLLEIDITSVPVKDLRELQRNIRVQLRKAKKYIAEAIDAGQAMEDRLNEYFNAILDLGFVRTKSD